MKLKSIYKTYHNQNGDILALNNISLNIFNKGITFIVGPSGCGKTTLLHIMSNQDREFNGNIQIDGYVEVIEQDILLFESMKVIDNLLMVSDDRVLIDEWLEKFEIKELSNQRISHLSIGQKKRIQVIRSLLVDSDYLICDEPTASLDYENAEIIMQTLYSVSRDKVVVIVAHEVALVEKYGDRIITMEHGKIINDQIVNKCDNIKQKNQLFSRKNLKQSFRLLLKNIVSHPFEIITKFCLVFLIFIMTFICTSLFSSTRQAVIERNKWRNSENLVITQPQKNNNQYRGHDENVEEDGSYFYYDLYNKQTIKLVKDNVSEVIGYRYGWTPQGYSLTAGSLVPEMTIEDIEKAIKEGDRIYKETGEIPFSQYNNFKRILNQVTESHPQGDFNKNIILTMDFRNYEGFKDKSFSNVPTYDDFRIGKKNAIDAVAYQYYDRYELPLKYGNQPIADHEVIISSELANLLFKEYQLNNEKELIGLEVPFSYFAGKETLVKICGISFMENRNENQIYFKEGTLDKWIEKSYEMNPTKLQYLYVYFLVDPASDMDKVIHDINNIVEGKESSFVSYNESFLTESNGYQNPFYFYVFSSLTCIGLLIIEVGMIILNQKRYRKEEALMRTYGYSSLFHVLTSLILICILVASIQFFILPFICQFINQFVNTLGFASFIEYNSFKYILSISLSTIILSIIEGGLYVSRTQKHL